MWGMCSFAYCFDDMVEVVTFVMTPEGLLMNSSFDAMYLMMPPIIDPFAV